MGILRTISRGFAGHGATGNDAVVGGRIYSVGYEGFAVDGLVERLASSHVTAVIDVRLTPSSRRPGRGITVLLGFALAVVRVVITFRPLTSLSVLVLLVAVTFIVTGIATLSAAETWWSGLAGIGWIDRTCRRARSRRRSSSDAVMCRSSSPIRRSSSGPRTDSPARPAASSPSS